MSDPIIISVNNINYLREHLRQRGKDSIMVAEYWTELPPKKELEKRLHKALTEAREMLERKKLL